MIHPFQLLVKPVAADCNLECGYCFYRPVNDQFGGNEARHLMSDETLETLIREYLSYRFDISVICWQGGEPTLAGLDFFEKVIAFEQRHGGDGQVIGNALQTNGLLINDAWARFLAEYRFLVGLSLDGPKEIHDTYRVNAKKRGSFDKVMAAAEAMRRRGVAFNILTVVSKANQDRAADVYKFFRKHGFSELQFIPCLEIDPASGKPAEFSATAEGYARFMTELFDLWIADDPAAVSIRAFDCFLGVAAGRPPDLCIHDKKCGSYLLIEHNGNVYPCDFFVRPEWRLGNIVVGAQQAAPLHEFFEGRRARQFASRKTKLDATCRPCSFIEICHGGCPKDWIAASGKAARKSLYCNSYKKFLERSMPEFRRLVSG